jgi:hypothetical protein
MIGPCFLIVPSKRIQLLNDVIESFTGNFKIKYSIIYVNFIVFIK